MSELPTIYGEGGKTLSAREFFVQLLNTPPKAEHIKINAQAKNSKYVPVNIIERQLDEFFEGLWSTENFTTQVIANEIVGSIELRVFDPVSKVWLSRIGCGSVMIQTASGQTPTVENKIKNTLVKDYPHLKAECLKNAAKSLGNVFGRNLNRDDDGDFETLSDKVSDAIERTDAERERAELLETALQILHKKNIPDINKAKGERQLRTYSINGLENYIKNNTNEAI